MNGVVSGVVLRECTEQTADLPWVRVTPACSVFGGRHAGASCYGNTVQVVSCAMCLDSRYLAVY